MCSDCTGLVCTSAQISQRKYGVPKVYIKAASSPVSMQNHGWDYHSASPETCLRGGFGFRCPPLPYAGIGFHSGCCQQPVQSIEEMHFLLCFTYRMRAALLSYEGPPVKCCAHVIQPHACCDVWTDSEFRKQSFWGMGFGKAYRARCFKQLGVRQEVFLFWVQSFWDAAGAGWMLGNALLVSPLMCAELISMST